MSRALGLECYRYTIFAALWLSPLLAQGELRSLDDSALATIRGQSGLSIELELTASADRIAYFDDGNGIYLEDFRIGAASNPNQQARHLINIDIADDASLNLDYIVEDRRIEFGDIRLAGAPGVSMGGLFFDHNLAGSLRIRSGGATGSGYYFDSAYSMTDGRLGYRTNGNEVFLDDIAITVEAPGVTLDLIDGALAIYAPSLIGSYSIGAVRFSGNPANHGASRDIASGELLSSYGGFAGDFDLSSNTAIRAGGRSGEGLRIDNQTVINSANFIYRDDAQQLALRDISGYWNVVDLRMDVAADWQGRNALALTLGRLNGELKIGRIEMGANGQSLGAVNLSFLLDDAVYSGESYSNAVYLQGGGHPDSSPQGLRLATEWSLQRADISYTENGHRVIFSGLQSWGRGDITVNVTRDGELNGTRFYDGLRIGFDGVRAGYRLNGLRVGSEDAPLQGGTELLLALGFYPAYEFEMDGQLTLGAGGASGEGITINSDVSIRNGRAALLAAPYDEGDGPAEQKGLWISDLNYESQMRDATVDVTQDGLEVVQGEAWSTMDVGNLRVGNKDSGASFGRFVLEQYETGSSMVISPGGAGDVCAGGAGADAASCEASGGRWETRGDEGLTIGLKQILARAESGGRRNALTWETNRELDSSGQLVSNSGTRMVLNDIHTSDGGDYDGDGIDDNTFGIQTDIAVDVYQTRVVKKSDGADAQGVVGARGDEKIMDPSVAAGYRYVAVPGPEELASRPLGFAVNARARFRELSVNNIDLVHPVGGAQTAVYGVSMQNFDIKANLTATPMP